MIAQFVYFLISSVLPDVPSIPDLFSKKDIKLQHSNERFLNGIFVEEREIKSIKYLKSQYFKLLCDQNCYAVGRSP